LGQNDITMGLNEYFNKVYCINLDRRTDRWGECKEEFNKHNLNVYRVSAIDGSPLGLTGNEALIKTNIQILEDAKENNLSSVLILEDDVMFTSELDKIDEYMKALPPDWDVVYFGGNHNTHVGGNPPTVINDKVYRLHSTYTTHCVGVKSHMFDVLLDSLRKGKSPIDVEYVKLQAKYKFYCFYPVIATQRPSFSDIENRFVDYNWLIK